ncbi:MAG: phosphodiester glycosidase family protein [Armatimonadetes bacterium]|nr:phosphodiester glycosidase family protein [Armatimonadota bacterium]
MRVDRLVVLVATWACLAALGSAQIWEKLVFPGFTYRMEVDLSTPRLIHAIRYSPTTAWVQARSELGKGKVYAQEIAKSRATISEAVRSSGAIGGLNGDFFPFTGDPLGLMIRSGEVTSLPDPRRSAFGWNGRTMVFGPAVLEATATPEGGSPLAIDGLNQESGINMLCLNTEAAGFAKSKHPCAMALLQVLDGGFSANGRVRTRVAGLTSEGNIAVAPNSAVLVGTGSHKAEVEALSVGSVVEISMKMGESGWAEVENAVGGGPTLLKKGQIISDWAAQGFAESFALKRHPRTAVGRTDEGDVWFVAIDGRQAMSDGATLQETALILKRLGCVDAINLDGGGSTTINLFNLTLNRPSDGTERPVANGVLFFRGIDTRGKTFNDDGLEINVKAPETVTSASPALAKAFFEDGRRVPNREVIWACSGDAWIDQGGLIRAIKPGKATITAWVAGRVARAEIVVK